MSVFNQLKSGLARSKTGFTDRLVNLFSSGELNEEFYEELEEILVSGDVGIELTMKLVEELKEDSRRLKYKARYQVKDLLLEKLANIMSAEQVHLETTGKPHVIILVGVNGSGKTTSAAKLAYLYRQENKKVLLVAGDTFRAAAIEQLEIWAARAGVDLIKQQAGSDPSALYFDAMNSARARKIDVVIGDTAGRLHNKFNLMEELSKVHRVIGRCIDGAPHQVLLVIDATTGQNAIAQAKSFNEALPIDGIILTKLDGTARGGIVISIQDALNIPVFYIGIGEKMEDLTPFNPADFARALLDA